MLFADGFVGLLLLGLWIFCLIDVLTSNDAAIRNLPKLVWFLIVLFLADIGSLLWLIAGRPWGATAGARAARAAPSGFPEYDRPGRAAASNPDDDEAFLRQVRERAEAQRREYDARRKAELEAERDALNRRRDPDDPAPAG